MNQNIIIGLFLTLFIIVIYLFVVFRNLSSQDNPSKTIVTNNNVVEQPYHTHSPIDSLVTEDRVIELINNNHYVVQDGNIIRNVGPKELGFEISALGNRIDFNTSIKFNNPTEFQETTQFNGQIIGDSSEGVRINDDLNVYGINATGESSFHTIRDVDSFHPFVGMIVPLHVDFTVQSIIDEIKDKGWVLCDGNHGTPDLRGRFIWGGGENINDSLEGMEDDVDEVDTSYTQWGTNTGQVGGEGYHTLTTGEMPSHNHPFRILDEGWNGANISNPAYIWDPATSDRLHLPFSNNGIDFTGEDKPHNNLPPYMVLAYFMYLPNWQS